ncbi:hypothetical protein BH23BAC1_BH23BAC1_20580 [soil metagenome]
MGLEVCREIRKIDSSIPILFLTALGTSEKIVLGLESGADDYLVKPFKFIELLARIRTLLRRVDNNSSPVQDDPQDEFKYKAADLELNDFTKTVTRNDIPIPLTTTEYRLLLDFCYYCCFPSIYFYFLLFF